MSTRCTGKLSKRERVKKYGEVFTPAWCVRDMVDMVYREDPEGAAALGSTWLEPACGDGAFLAEILRRKLDRCRTADDVRTACGTLYGVEIQQDNVDACRARLEALVTERFGAVDGVAELLRRNIVCGNFLARQTTDGAPIWFLDEEDNHA